MTLSDAITARTSLRSYLRVPISAEQRLELGKTIDQSNQRAGLHIQLICDQPEPFASLTKSYGCSPA